MSFLEKVSAREAETWAFTPDEVKDIARQADAEVERLRAELSKIKSAAGSEDPIALIEAGKKLPRTCDGAPVYPGMFVWFLSNFLRGTGSLPEQLKVVGWEYLPGMGPGFMFMLNVVNEAGDADGVNLACCYSTEQLAREAKEKGDAERK